ncbi:hypothetical protein MUO14_06780 [Halobacillus shinanisalinarum]|uniref:Uncharacterized protein n=1 Tax=Halobacillus shinanisalinarum TaxID=2932258 RepID=A0ABY4H2G8_9BACI|nr:hypothetical protein [Halobacillus shinanisalinarum]UOQ94647.1 hypothetical protein MUO14_06780 [Halobacillus shinanisalinarum]
MEDDRNEDYEALFQYVLSFAKKFGYDDVIIYDKQLDGYFPSLEFEERLHVVIEENDNEVFWDQLGQRLAKRDLEKERAVIQDQDEYFRRLYELEGKYEEEFISNGIKNIDIQSYNS